MPQPSLGPTQLYLKTTLPNFSVETFLRQAFLIQMKSAEAIKKENLFWAIKTILQICPFINHLCPSTSSVTMIKK